MTELQEDINKLVEWAYNVNWISMLITVLWCASDTTTCKATISCVQSVVAKNRSTAGPMNHHHQRPQVVQETEKSCKTANWVLWLIAHIFRHLKNTDLVIPLHKSQVRPYLEYAVQFWSPHLWWDIDKTEKVQRRATKTILEIRNHIYHQRIRYLDFLSLGQERLRGQLIEVYINGFTTARARGLFDYGRYDRTWNNGGNLFQNISTHQLPNTFRQLK